MRMSGTLQVKVKIQGVFLTSTSTKKLIQARLGVSRTIYANVDTPNLGFTYVFFGGGGAQLKNPLYVYTIVVIIVTILFTFYLFPWLKNISVGFVVVYRLMKTSQNDDDNGDNDIDEHDDDNTGRFVDNLLMARAGQANSYPQDIMHLNLPLLKKPRWFNIALICCCTYCTNLLGCVLIKSAKIDTLLEGSPFKSYLTHCCGQKFGGIG